METTHTKATLETEQGSPQGSNVPEAAGFKHHSKPINKAECWTVATSFQSPKSSLEVCATDKLRKSRRLPVFVAFQARNNGAIKRP